MISEKLKSIETLNFDLTKTEPSMEFAVRKYRTWGANDGCDYQLAIIGPGFEASRNLNSDELLMMRDWINEILIAKSEAA